jgi:tRNA pseudouridine38-40 synthase
MSSVENGPIGLPIVRLRIDLAYDGTDFHGWAAQPGLRTVQGELSAALALALRVPEVAVVCAGRTDTGVHARGQVVHLDVDETALVASAGRSPDPPVESLLRRLNGILPADVRVRRVVEAPDGFDARFGALWRRYAYRIADTPASLDPLRRSEVLAWPRPLDLGSMNAASATLLGRQDFASFCKRREGATTIRTLLELTPSATAWCGRWSAASSRSARGAGRTPGPPRSCAPRPGTPRWPLPLPAD